MFKGYAIKKFAEGAEFKFWVGDEIGQAWYDTPRSTPLTQAELDQPNRNFFAGQPAPAFDPSGWLEMQFIRIHLVRLGDVVFECGAHHGLTTMLFASWVGPEGKVFAFESAIANYEFIQKIIALNRLNHVTAYNKAVGREKCAVEISSESNSVVQRSDNVFAASTEVAEMVPLDDYAHLKPSFIKIDVEGCEVDVLKGARRILQNKRRLAIEVHADDLLGYHGSSVEELLGILNAQRYELWIHWDAASIRVPYDGSPITTRVHLFAM